MKRRYALVWILSAFLLLAGAGLQILGQTQQPPVKQHFLVFLYPTWKTAEEQEKAAPVMKEHANYLKTQFEAGRLIVGGPRVDGAYGFGVLEVDSAEEARAMMENDPSVKAGLMRLEIHAVRLAFVRSLH